MKVGSKLSQYLSLVSIGLNLGWLVLLNMTRHRVNKISTLTLDLSRKSSQGLKIKLDLAFSVSVYLLVDNQFGQCKMAHVCYIYTYIYNGKTYISNVEEIYNVEC